MAIKKKDASPEINRDIVVIGALAGGVKALVECVRTLSHDFRHLFLWCNTWRRIPKACCPIYSKWFRH
ncbi:MAG: hypothetical protein JWQ14_1995 [Adhaeribacter sp.]|nr:hypothetical protein [Adhaeribacter sp.]